MKSLGPKTLQLVVLCGIFLLLVGLWWTIRQRAPESSASSTTPVTDEEAGLKVSIPSVYTSYLSNASHQSDSQVTKGLIGNYVRPEPTAYLTLRYDAGLRSVTGLLNRSVIQHIEAEIAEFFPVKYGSSYQSLETKHITVAGHESVEHRFRYISSSGEELHARMIAIPFNDDVAYYLILQSAPEDFERIQADLDVVKDSLQLSGPQPPVQSS